eukprot:TRINITY_DN3668_c0_g1_i1.p1 TRINITY_DN3668_c0_g1~~TRINITY_DN3668_c0_g1_i1.p1  ORF type:complete len:718 (-),score=132.72 TRINITY_DN3668_c0_g1_i1:89-2242(-)
MFEDVRERSELFCQPKGTPSEESDDEEELSTNRPTSGGSKQGASADGKKAVKKRKKKKAGRVIINTNYCKYDVVREAAASLGWEEDPFDEDDALAPNAVTQSTASGSFNVMWTDTSIALQRVMKLQPHQRINHFPSMHLICRKISLCITLGRMKKVCPAHFKFFPNTWCLPAEVNQFRKYLAALHKKKTFIIKPSAGCQGKGIMLTRSPMDIVETIEDCVVQQYVTKPMLLEGFKFDMRVYALVTSVTDLTIFLFDDGLVRMCTEKYVKPSDTNLENMFMHLTNYAINKNSGKFIQNCEETPGAAVGSKRDFIFLNNYLAENGMDKTKCWVGIEDVIIKTLISAQPQLKHVYNACFPHKNDGHNCYEVLGFDIMLDHKQKPILLEVNHSPSFTTDSPLDHRIKFALIRETMQLINVRADDRQRESLRAKEKFRSRMEGRDSRGRMEEMDAGAIEARRKERSEYEDSAMQHYRRIYPCEDEERMEVYVQLMAQAAAAGTSATAATAASKQRERKVPATAPAAPPGKADSEPAKPVRKVPSARPPLARVAAPRQDTEAEQRQKLEAQQKLLEQMEKHKRRMQLGPRLSVIQLYNARQQIIQHAMEEYGEAIADRQQQILEECLYDNPVATPPESSSAPPRSHPHPASQGHFGPMLPPTAPSDDSRRPVDPGRRVSNSAPHPNSLTGARRVFPLRHHEITAEPSAEYSATIGARPGPPSL